MPNDLYAIYNRYTSRTLFFKYCATATLTHRLTRRLSLFTLKKCLTRPQGRIFSLVNSIYFGGETLEEVKSTVTFLARSGIGCVLDYAVEGENEEVQFDKAVENTLRLIEMSQQTDSLPFVVIKPSSLGSVAVYARQSEESLLDEASASAWSRIVARFSHLFDYACSHGVRVMVDAEQTAIQPAVDRLVLDMMREFNRDSAVITLTLQFYLKDQLRFLDECYQRACQDNFVLGVKVVRGAYLEEEKRVNGGERCFATKEETDRSYNAAVDYIAQRLDRISPFFATHNEESLALIMKIESLRAGCTWIGQLYGLGDHITYSLLQTGFRVCKYLPYGPLDKSLPYLLRRIEENAIASATFKKENKLLQKELLRRLVGGR
ncbi:proline dehydrogenase family protein [Pectobacterium cacticida]|uniref:Carbapenem biosynthesis protein CarD n=1 Tax=Pectobacterium cacticida TaxID=69221 RepID=A0ABZ2GCS9_9GAMM|nr:carbapenem biosynthesis protein CarD [Pectobacterium cacticida]UYX06583.1 proline dehydrogenase family protein [Pectobacterium cacticida]